MLTMAYAGIGSRVTPEPILQIMTDLGEQLARKGLTLRSGGAHGADAAFETGCDKAHGRKEIFVPWNNFNDRAMLYPLPQRAFVIAEHFHPAWQHCSGGAKKLHARNCLQVLGPDLDTPSDFIVCWTKQSGGTQQALRIAKAYDIPVFNLIEPDALHKLLVFLA